MDPQRLFIGSFKNPLNSYAATSERLTEEDREYVPASELEAVQQALAAADNWILRHPYQHGGDHACAECHPESEIIQPGFVCAYHAAQARKSLTPGPNEH